MVKRFIAAGVRFELLMLTALFCTVSQAADERLRPTVAVLEFHDYSNYQNHLLGRRVADALCSALNNTSRWETVDSSAVRRAIRTLNLKPPFAVGYQQAVAHEVGADMIVTGRVEGVEIAPTQGTVKVVIIADFIDQIVGQSALPIQVTGMAMRDGSNPRPTDVIVEEAISEACRLLAEASITMPRGSAEVTQINGSELTLRADTDATLLTGDRMLLFRKRTGHTRQYELIACLMVKRLDGISVHTKVLGHIGDIYTGDVAICVGPARSELDK